MLKLLKWAVIGCIGLVAVDAATDGEIAREFNRATAQFRCDQQTSITAGLKKARKHLARSERDVEKSYRQYAAAVAEQRGVEQELARLKLDQQETFRTAKYLESRLSVNQAVYNENYATLTRAQMEAQLAKKWKQLEWNEKVIAEKEELVSMHSSKVQELAKRHESFTERQRELRLRLIRLEARLDKLRQHPRFKMPKCDMNDLERAEDLAKQIEEQLNVRTQQLEYGLQVLPEHATIEMSSPEVRRRLEEKYQEDSSDV